MQDREMPGQSEEEMGAIPQTYGEWEHCITVKCGIELTPAFVAQRIDALADPDDFHTKKFVDYWGEAHHIQILAWFREAADRLKALSNEPSAQMGPTS